MIARKNGETSGETSVETSGETMAKRGRKPKPSAVNATSEDYLAGFVAGMDHLEAEAELKWSLGYLAGRAAVARETGDSTLAAPLDRREEWGAG